MLNNKDTVAAIDALKKALSMCDPYLLNTNFIISQYGEERAETIIHEFPTFKKNYEQSIVDKEAYKVKEELERSDAEIRNKKATMPELEFQRLLNFTDSVNQYALFQLVKNKKASPMCFLIYHLYGNNAKYFIFYDSILKADIYLGRVSPEAYAYWYDRQRVYVNQMKTQIYGEFNDLMFGNGEFQQIEDVENIDKVRASIGLCSLREYALIHNLKLPLNYK